MGLMSISGRPPYDGAPAGGSSGAEEGSDEAVPSGVEMKVMTAIISRNSRGPRSLLGFLTRRFKRAWPEVMTVTRKWKFSTGPRVSLALRIDTIHFEIRLSGEELVASVGAVIDGEVPRQEVLPIGSWAARLAIKLVELSPTSAGARRALVRLTR